MSGKIRLLCISGMAAIMSVNFFCHADEESSGSKKLISLGWDCPSTPYLREHYRKMEENSPYDGIAIDVTVKNEQGKAYNRYMFFTPDELKREWFANPLEDLRKCEFKKFKNNFLLFTCVSSQTTMPNLSDDSRWKTICANIANLAWLAKQSGCRGLILDPEDYNNNTLFKYNPESGKTFQECAALARKRGKQLMEAIGREFPDVTLICLWMFSLNQVELNSPNPNDALGTSTYGLYPAFLNGLLEALPPQAKMVDGCENAYLCGTRQEYLEQYFIMRGKALKLVSPDNLAKFKTQTQAAFAFYLDAYMNPKNSHYYMGKPGKSRLAALRENLEHAFKISDEYVWTWGEQCRWWNIPYPAGKHKAALERPGKYRLWYEAMPGISEVMRQAKTMQNAPENITPPPESANLLNNSNFEEAFTKNNGESKSSIEDAKNAAGLSGWNFWQPSRNKIQGTFLLARGRGIGGSSAATSRNIQKGCLIQEIPVQPGNKYLITGYASISGKASAYIHIRWKNKSAKWTTRNREAVIAFKGVGEWKRAAGIMTTPEGAAKMILLLYVENQTSEADTCYFDDFSVVCYGLTPTH